MSSTISKIQKLKHLFDSGQIPTLAEHEVNPGLPKDDRLNYIYFTLPVCLNFQRSSPAMWRSALATYNDPETNYVFYPERVAEVTFEKLQSDLIKHKLSLQKNKHTQIWQKISLTLFEDYNSDPRMIIKSGQNCVVRIKNLLQDKVNAPKFPYLRGSKIANYWLYILTQYTDVKLRNLHKISIIPDTHVRQASGLLGIADALANAEIISESWENVLKDSGITPVEMHPVLWNWSRNNFVPEV